LLCLALLKTIVPARCIEPFDPVLIHILLALDKRPAASHIATLATIVKTPNIGRRLIPYAIGCSFRLITGTACKSE